VVEESLEISRRSSEVEAGSSGEVGYSEAGDHVRVFDGCGPMNSPAGIAKCI
jgi:hypothetical protein